MNSALWRRVREQTKAIAMLLILTVLGLGVAAYVLSNQRFYPPAWVPLIGQEWFDLDGEFSAAPGVMPGQGQAVTIAGVRVGEVTGVSLRNGRAVVGMRLRTRYANIHPDATLLLRPKTTLKDMVVELDPGTAAAGPKLRSGATLGLAATAPDVNFDEIIAMLDSDTRASLAMLLTDGGRAVGGDGGERLAQVLRRFQPLSEHAAQATRLVARRRTQLTRVMGNLSKIATELGTHDRELTRFVRANEGAFRSFANQRVALSQTLSQLPDTLQQAEPNLRRIAALGDRLRGTSTQLAPAAADLDDALRGVRPFLRKTLPVARDQLRPFARAAQPTASILKPAVQDLADATPGLIRLTNLLNGLFNALAYDPPGSQEPYLFYVPWANHNTNSVLSSQDGTTATRRSLVMVSCGSAQLLKTLPRNNPTLATIAGLLNVPDYNQLVADGKCQGQPVPDEPVEAPTP